MFHNLPDYRMRLVFVSILVIPTSCLHMHLRGSSEAAADEGLPPQQLQLQEIPRYATFNDSIHFTANRSYNVELIKEFQRNHNLSLTGRLDQQTLRLLNAPRCGNSDFGSTATSLRIKMIKSGNQSSYQYRWPRITLTWKITVYTQKQSNANVHQILEKSLRQWTEATNFTFREELDPASLVHMEIGFFRGTHQDNHPFDGRGGTLAHAFFPHPDGSKSTLHGDVHFDDDEEWDRADGLTYLHWVALHELGHALGLSHSESQGALMYPYFGFLSGDPRVTGEDIKAFEQAYNGASSCGILLKLHATSVVLYLLFRRISLE